MHDLQRFKECLQYEISLEDLEKQKWITNKRLGPEPVLFGFMNKEWLKFKSKMEDGDKIWMTASYGKHRRCGDKKVKLMEGIALVRGDTIIEHIFSFVT